MIVIEETISRNDIGSYAERNFIIECGCKKQTARRVENWPLHHILNVLDIIMMFLCAYLSFPKIDFKAIFNFCKMSKITKLLLIGQIRIN